MELGKNVKFLLNTPEKIYDYGEENDWQGLEQKHYEILSKDTSLSQMAVADMQDKELEIPETLKKFRRYSMSLKETLVAKIAKEKRAARKVASATKTLKKKAAEEARQHEDEVANNEPVIDIEAKDEIEYATNKGLTIEYLEPLDRMRIVTLIGSGKFLSTFKSVAQILTLKGFIVNTPAIFDNESFMKGDVELSEESHKMYDDVHRQKMNMSDFVVLIHNNQYIGKDTREEIEYCNLRGITVIDYEKLLFDESKFPEPYNLRNDNMVIKSFILNNRKDELK